MGIHLCSSCVACWKVHWRQYILDQLLPVLTLFTCQCQCLLVYIGIHFHRHKTEKLSLSLCLYLSLCLSFPFCLSLPLCLSLSFYLSLSLSLCFSLSLSLSLMFLLVLDELLNNGNGYRSSPRRSVQCGALLHIHDSPLHQLSHHCLKNAIFAKIPQPFISARSSYSHSDLLAIHP